MTCPISVKYKGSKSDVIKQLINEKEMVKVNKNIKLYMTTLLIKKLDWINQLVDKKKLIQRQLKHVELSIDEAEKEIDAFLINKPIKLEPHGHYSETRRYFRADRYYCFVPNKVLEKLNTANTLKALGKLKESRKIFDDIISDYQLTELK